MQKIVFYTAEKNAYFSRLLLQNLSDSYTITWTGEKEAFSRGSGTDLLILETDKLSNIELSDAIIVFDENCMPSQELRINGNCICLAASDNHNLLKILSGSHAKVITCGMSPKDTFTYSSKGEASIAVSLQRELLTLQGQSVEPLELVLSCPGEANSYALLFYVAILILLGIVTECPDDELTIH